MEWTTQAMDSPKYICFVSYFIWMPHNREREREYLCIDKTGVTLFNFHTVWVSCCSILWVVNHIFNINFDMGFDKMTRIWKILSGKMLSTSDLHFGGKIVLAFKRGSWISEYVTQIFHANTLLCHCSRGYCRISPSSTQSTQHKLVHALRQKSKYWKWIFKIETITCKHTDAHRANGIYNLCAQSIWFLSFFPANKTTTTKTICQVENIWLEIRNQNAQIYNGTSKQIEYVCVCVCVCG